MSEWVPEVVCNRDRAETMLHCCKNVSFHLLISDLSAEMSKCALHIEASNSYSDIVIYLLKAQVVSEGTVMFERSFPLSYAQHRANLNHNIDSLSFLLMTSPKAVSPDKLRNRYQLFIFPLLPFFPASPLFSSPNLVCTLAYMSHAYSYIHIHTLACSACSKYLFHGHVHLHMQTRYIYL